MAFYWFANISKVWAHINFFTEFPYFNSIHTAYFLFLKLKAFLQIRRQNMCLYVEYYLVFNLISSKTHYITRLHIRFKKQYNHILSYLWYDPCRPTSMCSRRWPYKIPVHTLYSTVRCVSYLTGINSLWCTSQGISNWSLVLQYTIEAEYLYYCYKRDNWD